MRRQGFTLIELMICIAIAGIVVSLALQIGVSCIKYGYPRSQVSRFTTYCVRTVNGNDEVIKLDELIERSQERLER